jgi:hypothetical protein
MLWIWIGTEFRHEHRGGVEWAAIRERHGVAHQGHRFGLVKARDRDDVRKAIAVQVTNRYPLHVAPRVVGPIRPAHERRS